MGKTIPVTGRTSNREGSRPGSIARLPPAHLALARNPYRQAWACPVALTAEPNPNQP